MSPRTGRRPGDHGAREAILAAARRAFGEHGFTGATMRAIAAEAGVDPALVHHYYGTKVDLFAAAVRLPVSPNQVFAALVGTDRAQWGEALLRRVLALWDQPEGLAAWLGLLRSATSDERAAAMLREFLTTAALQHLADAIDDGDGEYRAALVASQVAGLGVARHVLRIEPLASASTDEVVAAVAPTLQRYLTGPVRRDQPPTAS